MTEKATKRLDVYLEENNDISRSKAQKLIEEEKILVNGSPSKKNYRVKEEDIVSVLDLDNEKIEIKAENIDIDIVYEDDYLAVINKSNNMVVHPGSGNHDKTLVNALMYHFNNLSSINGETRPGIVHRIDAKTTGLLVVAKDDKTHLELQKQLKDKTLNRKYIALVWGVLKTETAEINAPLGRDLNDRKKQAVTAFNSKTAVTHLKVIERYKNATLIELSLETGRTHQIRVHMNYINHPIVNDPVYGGRKIINDFGQMLHAKKLGFIHPHTKEYVEFSCELPKEFEEILNILKEE